MTQAEIVKKYLGIPFKHRGRDLSGLDCYGLIINIFKDAGIKLFDIEEEYSEEWAWKGRNLFLENAYREWQQVEQPKFLDIVGFVNSKGVVNHAGVMLTATKFIHTCKAGTVISLLNIYKKKNRISGFYRHKKTI
jgi:cell wall-associated NlpC family hydrolase